MRAPVLLLAALTACASPASQSVPTTSAGCDDGYHYETGRRGGALVCETRTLSARGRALAVDATPNGSIAVETWDGDGIRIEATVRAWAPTEDEARAVLRETEVQQRPGLVRTRLPEATRGAWSRDRPWSSVSYTLQVPRDAELDLETVNGGVTVRGVHGKTEFEVVNGGVTLDRVGGEVTGRTTNGPVTLDLARGFGPVDVASTNGPIDVSVPEDASAEVDARTTMGPVRFDGLPLRDVGCTGRETRAVPCTSGRVVGTLGGGTAPLRLSTTNGPIALRRR